MPYLGNEPGAITDAFTQTFTGDGSETNFTLSQSSTTNAVFVRISGVMQRNGTDFTVSGTTLAFTTAPPAPSNNIVVQFFTVGSIQTIADDAVATAKIADNAVTLAKLAGGTDGNLITFDASGDPAFVATGSSGQVLTSAGAGSPPTFATASGTGWEFVSGVTASDTANVTFTGMESGYDYMVNCYDFVPASDNKDLYVQYGTGATPTIQTSGYAYVTGGILNTSKTAESSTSASQVRLLGQGAGTGSNEQYCFSIEILNPADSGANTMSRGHGGGKEQSGNMLSQDFVFFRTTDEAVTAIKIYLSSSTNIATGKFFFYRKANA